MGFKIKAVMCSFACYITLQREGLGYLAICIQYYRFQLQHELKLYYGRRNLSLKILLLDNDPSFFQTLSASVIM